MKGNEFLVGVVVGAVVGASLGLLFAPQSGEETREAIRSHALDLTDKVKESSRQLMDTGRDLIEQGKTQVTNTIRQHVDRAGNAKTGIGEA